MTRNPLPRQQIPLTDFSRLHAEFHRGNRSLSSLWDLFHPEPKRAPAAARKTVVRYCTTTSRLCTRPDRSLCSAITERFPNPPGTR